MRPRALLTGSAGFIGTHIGRELDSRYHVVRVDVKDGNDCRDLFRTSDVRFDLVVHCAATVGGREGIDHNAALLGANNIQLDGALFEWALRTRPGRVVYFSSAAAYPTRFQFKGAREHLHESMILWDKLAMPVYGTPDESYGWAKLTGEVIARRVREAGVPVTVVRPFSSYDHDQDDCYPFPEFVHRALRRDNPFIVWGDGTQRRDFIHVEDLVAAVLALVEREVDGPVNLGTGRSTSMDELAHMCMRAAGYEAPIRHLEDKPQGVHTRVAANDLLTRYYQPQITLEEGIRRSLRACR